VPCRGQLSRVYVADDCQMCETQCRGASRRIPYGQTTLMWVFFLQSFRRLGYLGAVCLCIRQSWKKRTPGSPTGHQTLASCSQPPCPLEYLANSMYSSVINIAILICHSETTRTRDHFFRLIGIKLWTRKPVGIAARVCSHSANQTGSSKYAALYSHLSYPGVSSETTWNRDSIGLKPNSKFCFFTSLICRYSGMVFPECQSLLRNST
jgi:hypothetical protein